MAERRTPLRAKLAGRRLIERVLSSGDRFSQSEWRMLLALLHQIVLFDRVEDEIPMSTLAEIVGLSSRQARRVIQKLAARGVGLRYTPGTWRNKASHIGLDAPLGEPLEDLKAPGMWGVLRMAANANQLIDKATQRAEIAEAALRRPRDFTESSST